MVTLGVGLAIALLGIGAWFGAARTPEWALMVTAPVSVLVIGGLNLLTSDAGTGSQLFLLWPVLYTASFLPPATPSSCWSSCSSSRPS